MHCCFCLTAFFCLAAISLTTLDPSSGQSGTVTRFEGLLPPNNGDNSTINRILIGGVEADILNRDGSFVIVRAGPSPVAIPYAIITIVTNYSMFVIDSPMWMYTTPGNITMVTPSRGQEGTRVVISGENLMANPPNPRVMQPGVLLAGVEAVVESSNSTTLICTATSSNPQIGPITINYMAMFAMNGEIVLYDDVTIVSSITWEQLADGNITRIIPTIAAANSTVLVCGDSPLGDGNETTSVTIGGTLATQFSSLSFIIDSLTCINVTLPANISGVNSIQVVANTGGIVRSQVNVTIAAISSVDRSMGQYGTRVNISGVQLFENITSTSIMLAGVNATIVDQDDVNKSWVVVRAGRPPQFFSTNMTQNCSQSELCTPINNITSICASVNCSVNFTSDTFVTEMCLTNCSGQNVSLCYSRCSVNGTFNQTCFLECGQSSNISINSTCLSTCAMPCCVDASTINCTNITTCTDLNVTVPIDQAFTGQVAIVTTELGLVFNLTNETVLWTYNISGGVDTVDPIFGQIGTRVALNGTNLFGYGIRLDQLLVNGTRVEAVTANDSFIQFDAPVIDSDRSNVGFVDVQLISDTGAIVDLTAGFEYRTPGMITGFIPSVGQRGTYGMCAHVCACVCTKCVYVLAWVRACICASVCSTNVVSQVLCIQPCRLFY